MDDSQYTISEHQLSFFDRRHPVGLLLLSVPAFIVSLYFGYILISTFIDYMANATSGEWISALPGIIFLLVLFTAALAAGVYTASRKNIIVDTKLGVIGTRREFLGLHNKGKILNLAKIKKIICRQKSVKGTTRPGDYNPSTIYYHVDILTREDQQVPLINFKYKKQARQLGKRIAEFADIELNDRL